MGLDGRRNRAVGGPALRVLPEVANGPVARNRRGNLTRGFAGVEQNDRETAVRQRFSPYLRGPFDGQPPALAAGEILIDGDHLRVCQRREVFRAQRGRTSAREQWP